jgi:hypothetical protein
LAYGAAEISFGRGAFITETIPALPQQIDLNFADAKSHDSVKSAPEIAAASLAKIIRKKWAKEN